MLSNSTNLRDLHWCHRDHISLHLSNLDSFAVKKAGYLPPVSLQNFSHATQKGRIPEKGPSRDKFVRRVRLPIRPPMGPKPPSCIYRFCRGTCGKRRLRCRLASDG